MRQGLWRFIGVRDGLPSAVILDLLQDRHGSMWFATNDKGVFRYDGVYFHCFTSSDGLVDDRVNTLLEDRQGHLWFGTHNGASRWDGTSFKTYTSADGLPSNRIVSLLEDRRGHLWFGTADKGVGRWDGTAFTALSTADGLPHNRVMALLEDRCGHLWFGTGKGVSCWDGTNFSTYTTADGLGGDRVLSILEDRQGYLWFATFPDPLAENPKGGISRFTPEGISTAEHRTTGQPMLTFSGQEILGDPNDSVAAMSLIEDRAGHLWFSLGGNGACHWDGERFARLSIDDGLANNQVNAICQDRIGDIWFATWGGISVYASGQFANYTSRNGLKTSVVFALLQDQSGHIWVGTNSAGISRWDGHRFTSFTQADGLASDNVRCLLEDRQGNLWAMGWEGISRWDGAEFRPFPLPEALQVKQWGWSMLEDSQGHFWFATYEGLVRWDSHNVCRYTTTDGLPYDNIMCMLEDRSGRLWFGGHQTSIHTGICCWNDTGFTAFEPLSGKKPNTIVEDRRGRLWFGTWNHGVICWDGDTFSSLTTADGLCYDNVQTIVEDRRGHFWFGTFGGGVSIYDGLVCQTLSRQDGLAHDTVQEIIEDQKGHIWIATEGGLTRYTPFEEPPQVHIAQVHADQSYAAADSIEIPSWQKSVLFEFGGRSFTTPAERLVYVCRLQGYEDDWKPVYAARIEYQQLPEGEYTFQVRAVDRDLNYSEPAEIQLVVAPDSRLAAFTEALSGSDVSSEFVGQSAALAQVLTQSAEVAPSDLTVLILGETGTGKGLAARAIHSLSQRRHGPFIPINCGALPKDLVESELFGHERGAFTGAHARKLGKVEVAAGGTLFLDEIGDMPLEAQVKLLGLLEERTYERVGGTQTHQADVRVIAATNRDLEQMVREGRFRQDLFFRLQVFPLPLPPLRQRREDIPLLAAYFAERIATHLDKEVAQVSPAALAKLQAYPWPGNVRELEHVIQRAVIVCRGKTINSGDLLLGSGQVEQETPDQIVTLEDNERTYIRKVLEQCNWQIKGSKGAAAQLGLAPSTLRDRMKRLGLERP